MLVYYTASLFTKQIFVTELLRRIDLKAAKLGLELNYDKQSNEFGSDRASWFIAPDPLGTLTINCKIKLTPI